MLRKIIIFAFMLLFISMINIFAEEILSADSNYLFTIADSTAEIVRYKGEATELIIPPSLEYKGRTYLVTSIKEEAFYESSLISVTIPGSVTSIGDNAFAWCRNLASVDIPDGVISIGGWAFARCESLTSVTIPSSVTTVGEWAFARCENLTSITIPDSVTFIGDNAFAWCSSLISGINYKKEIAADFVTLEFSSQLFSNEILDIRLYKKIDNGKKNIWDLTQENNFTSTINSTAKKPRSKEKYIIEISFNNEEKDVILFSKEEEVQYAANQEYQISFQNKVIEDFNKIYLQLQLFNPLIELGILSENREKFEEKRESLENIYRLYTQYQNPDYFYKITYQNKLIEAENHKKLKEDITNLYTEHSQVLVSTFINSIDIPESISNIQIADTYNYFSEILEDFENYDVWRAVKDKPEIRKAIQTVEDIYGNLKEALEQQDNLKKALERQENWKDFVNNQKNRHVIFVAPVNLLYMSNYTAPFDDNFSAEILNIHGSWGFLPFMFLGGDFVSYEYSVGSKLMLTTGFNLTFIEILRPYILGGLGVSIGEDYGGVVGRFAIGMDFLIGKRFAMNLEYSLDNYTNVGFVHRFSLGFGANFAD